MNNEFQTEINWLRKQRMRQQEPERTLQHMPPSGGDNDDNNGLCHQTMLGGFADVAGMEDLKSFIDISFIQVVRNREIAARFGLQPTSMMLFGPPGCGKTYLANSIANECQMNFIKVTPDQVGSIYQHGPVKKIAELFKKAEEKSPVILFLDEIDAFLPKRSDDSQRFRNAEVNQFLCLLNNANEKGIYLIAATNHPELIDSAVLRPGRINEMIYIDLPDLHMREELFRFSLKKLPAEKTINYHTLAVKTKGFNCADINYVVNMAARHSFEETLKNPNKSYRLISQDFIEQAINKRAPSVSSDEIRFYEQLKRKYSTNGADRSRTVVGFH